MKKISFTVIICMTILQTFGQLNYDLRLVKPLINFNDINGGFYSDYYKRDLNHLYCGAIVQNVGNLTAANVYLKINFLDDNNNILSTYFSDTIATLDQDQTDTIKIQQEISTDYWDFRISYKIKSDSLDENEFNNTDTIPYIKMYDGMWTQVSRANVPTNTLNINQVTDFQSGDFIGVTLKVPNDWHEIFSISVYISDLWPDSLSITGKIYQNGIPTDSVQFFNSGYSPPYWVSAVFPFSEAEIIFPDSTYYFGVGLNYPIGTNIPIGIDTSSFHNFSAETAAKINNEWSTLNFVPLVKLLCDPEGVNNLKENNQVQVYPNPTSGIVKINVENVHSIELLNSSGIILKKTGNVKKDVEVNLSDFPNGIYFIKIYTNKGMVVKKIIKQ